MFNPRAVFRFIAEVQQQGLGAVLVTITAVTGASTRNPGAHLAVASDGRFGGSLSGGCIEAAVVAEALATLAEGVPRAVRFGAGSPFIDIRLPCGGGVDLLFNPLEAGFGATLLALFERRQPIALHLPATRGTPSTAPGSQDFGITAQAHAVRVNHIPPLRLAILGHGAGVDALRDIALASAADVLVVSPDADLIARTVAAGAEAKLLHPPTDAPGLALDRWTAAAMLFHDHDWEPELLAGVLASDAFFVGAMGSRKTHGERCDRLRGSGVDEVAIGRIVAPIGLIPSMRDPETLAVSVLAQVIERYNRLFLL